MNKTLLPLCLVGLCVLLAGCGGQDYPGAKRFPLVGTAICDGEPVDVGSISFIPIEGGEQRVSGGPIWDGEFSVPEEQGAHAANYRVEIRWQKRTGKTIRDRTSDEMVEERAEGLPAKYHKDSELTVEVPSPDNRYDFNLTSN